MADKMPVVFFGHGNPMNALQKNRYTEGWAAIGAQVPRPSAVLCISAHWYIERTATTINTAPPTLHDFGGFPPELYEVQYPAPGDPQLARRVQQLLAQQSAELREDWGLDHGTWSVLCHVYPQADVPVVQLSINATRDAAYHYEIGRLLAPLRREGVLIAGSGNLVHNLRTYAWGGPREPYDWAIRFEDAAKEKILSGNHKSLLSYEAMGRDAALSIPTPDHYLPLLYVLGASEPGDPVTFPIDGIEGGSISMLTVRFG